MRCYTGQHRFYCGVDLHARTMFVHILDRKGKTVFAEDLSANPAEFLAAIKPYRKDLVVGVECMFAWYWLADLCEAEGIPFALGHALAMKHIHGGKSKSDPFDTSKLAGRLRSGQFQAAYAYRRSWARDGATTPKAARVDAVTRHKTNVVGGEAIEVPAGTFKAIRVDSIISLNGEPNGRS
jgi:Transposase